MNNLEDEYSWEIKSYLESPTRESLIEFLEQVYEDGFEEGYSKGVMNE